MMSYRLDHCSMSGILRSCSGRHVQLVLPIHRCMAVAKGRPGHLTVLCASLLLLLLLAFSSRASARDSLHEASSRGKGGAKYAQKAAATAASSRTNRQRAARAGKQQQQRQHPAQLQQEQRAGPSLLDRDGSAAGTSKKDAQLQQRAGHGGEKSSREKGSQQQGGGLQAEGDFPGQESRGAAREPGKQPKALHAEQFPGNGAQVRTWSDASRSLCAATDCHPGPGGVKRADSSELRNVYSSCTTEKSPSRPALADHPPR